ncbi:MAG: hypothetical protein WCI77_00950 [Candidatus Omnitrophota bacterium]
MTSRFGFTAIDKELVGDSRLADPMGILPIWSYFGRALIPNLTEQTGQARGFYLLCSILSLYEKYVEWAEKKNNKIMPVEQFYILVEQVFAYAVFYNTGDWNLRGDRNVKYFMKDNPNQITISLHKQLLGSQLATGTWGLYRGAAMRSEILDASGKRLTEKFASLFSFELEREESLFQIIHEAHSNGVPGAELKLNSRLCNEVYKKFRIGKNKELFCDFLINNYQVKDFQLMKAVAEDLVNYEIEGNDYRKFVVRYSAKFKEHAYVFKDIIKCEDFIGTIDSIFPYLYSQKDKNLKEIASNLPLNIKDIQNAHKSFSEVSNIPPTSIVAGKRYSLFTGSFDISTKEELIRWILDLHEKIARSKSGLPWLELSGDRLAIRVDYFPSDKLKVVPGQGWRSPYYLDVLASIYKEIR